MYRLTLKNHNTVGYSALPVNNSISYSPLQAVSPAHYAQEHQYMI